MSSETTLLAPKRGLSDGVIQAPVKKQKTRMKPAIVSIEGIVGSGKSAIMDWIEERYKDSDDVIVIREPSEVWESIQVDGKNLLDLSYENRDEHGFAFQLLYFLAVERQLRRAILDHADKRILVGERSLLSAKDGYYGSMEGSYRSDIEVQVNKKLFEKEGVGYLYPDQMILLDRPPNLCLGRVSRKDWKNDEINYERLRKITKENFALENDKEFCFGWGTSNEEGG